MDLSDAQENLFGNLGKMAAMDLMRPRIHRGGEPAPFYHYYDDDDYYYTVI